MRVTVVDKNKAVVCCLLATSAVMLSEKKKRKCKMWSKKWCLKRNIQRVPLATEPGLLADRCSMSQQLGALQTHTTDTFFFISHTTNLLLFKFRCNTRIFIGVRIIKEMPCSVASGTLCMKGHVLSYLSHANIIYGYYFFLSFLRLMEGKIFEIYQMFWRHFPNMGLLLFFFSFLAQ